jgi:hypothetical protein
MRGGIGVWSAGSVGATSLLLAGLMFGVMIVRNPTPITGSTLMSRDFIEVVDKMIALVPDDSENRLLKKLFRKLKVHHYITPPESSYTCWIRSTEKLVDWFEHLNDLSDWEKQILDVWTDARIGSFRIWRKNEYPQST